METLQTFHGVLDRGFTGNMSFQFHIPHGIHELSVILTYEKERIQDPASYIERFRHPLIRQAVPYLGRIPTDRQLQEMVQALCHDRRRLCRKCPYAGDEKGDPVKGRRPLQRLPSL